MHKRFSISLTCLVLSLCVPALSFDLKIENGPIQYHETKSSLSKTLQSIAGNHTKSTYIGYSVPSTQIYENNDGSCAWDLVSNTFKPGTMGGFHFKKEPATGAESINIILKMRQGSLERLSLLADGCSLDAGGETIHWVNGVDPASSIAWFSQQIGSGIRDSEEAVTAIAMHRHPTAIDSLVSFSQAGVASEIRRSGVFWLGQLDDSRGSARLAEMVENEDDTNLREHLAFVLSTMNSDDSRDLLYSMAMQDATARIRHKALFWMCQSGHPEAKRLILEKIESETDSEFLEEAGFMLSQLPNQRGMTHLANFAENHPSPNFRQNAIFWLAQSIHEQALPAILRSIEKDSSLEVRKHAVFALSQVKGNESLEALIQLAESHKESSVRGTALFWLGQKASERVKETLKASVMNDEDKEVMEQALLGLTQLPKDEKVPLLLDIAQTHPVPEIREQALFWLGQSGDERAISLFKQILSAH